MKPLVLNETNFDAALAAGTQPVLVDFWAEWCGPCKMLNPVLEELVTEQAGKAVVAKVNIEESPELAVRFGVSAIPTLLVFRNGQPVRTLRGVQSRKAIAAALAEA
jgi:thioredoxin 1